MNKLIETVKDLIFFLTHPSYWIMNYPYRKEYDRWFNELLDKHELEEVDDIISGYIIKIGGYKFWIENQPYACFTNRYIKRKYQREVRPSRRTIHKTIKKLDEGWKY